MFNIVKNFSKISLINRMNYIKQTPLLFTQLKSFASEYFEEERQSSKQGQRSGRSFSRISDMEKNPVIKKFNP